MKTHRARAMAMSPLLVRAVVAGRVPSGIEWYWCRVAPEGLLDSAYN